MQAPYNLPSQYWPLEEQETLYRNSKALCPSFLSPFRLALFLPQISSLSLSFHTAVTPKPLVPIPYR